MTARETSIFFKVFPLLKSRRTEIKRTKSMHEMRSKWETVISVCLDKSHAPTLELDLRLLDCRGDSVTWCCPLPEVKRMQCPQFRGIISVGDRDAK